MYSALKQPRTLFLIGTGVFLCAIGLLLFSANMQRGLSHDEHMYVAGGELLARGLGLPYRDFPYLQMPNLVFIYAALFGVSDYLLLSARLLSTLAALGSLTLVFVLVSNLLRGSSYLVRFLLAAGSVSLIINNPIFNYTSGQAWNHDLPVFFCLGALALLRRGALEGGQGKWVIVSGLLAGLAVGTRLLFLLVVPAFIIFISILPPGPSMRGRSRPVGLFGAGVGLGLLPSLVMFALAPGQFLYGNFVYHQANGEFWEKIGYMRAMDLAGKLGYLWEVVLQPANLVLALGLLTLGIAAILMKAFTAFAAWREFYLALTLTIALSVGAFVPDPSWYQYYFAPLPFLVLSIVYCAAALYRVKVWPLALFALMVLLSFIYRSPFFPLENLLAPDRWATVRAHKMGEEIRKYVGDERVLTFAPIYPLEGGARIYSDFAAGPFTWRSITLLSEGKRAASGLMSPVELNELLDREPPKAILVGFEPDLEVPWIEYAQERGYKEVALGDGAILWLAP
ncbi:MAG TPA: glycosyltransferase family 39 protein [Chloroflexia bacterium]|nr:glycosyltransferase family 39 protein [Chloroflexia bacterium]